MRKLKIKEYEEGNPNTKIDVLLKDFSKYLKNKDILVTDIDYSTKTIYVDTIDELKKSRYLLKTEFPELRQLGCHIQSAVGVPGSGLNRDYIMKNRAVSESLWDEDEEDSGRYTYIKSKEVNDYDGMKTEYTMYYDTVDDRYVFVFGDSDMYDPNYGYEEFDWECDAKSEADRWFWDYTGYEDDLDESIKSYNESFNKFDEVMQKYENCEEIETAFRSNAIVPGNKERVDTIYAKYDSSLELRDYNRYWYLMGYAHSSRGYDYDVLRADDIIGCDVSAYMDGYYITDFEGMVRAYPEMFYINDDLDESLKESGDIEKLSLQDFYRWFDINYGGDLEDFRDYKVALTKAKVVRLRNNKYIFDTDEALKYDRNGQLK